MDHWAIAHRNWHAIFTVFGLGGILIWALISNDDFVRRDRVMATVVEVKTAKVGHFVKLKLPNGKHAILSIDRQVPKVGEKRPVFIDIYDNGKDYVTYDRMEWTLNY